LFGVALLQGLVELFEALELRGEATLGGGVHDENDLALEGGERESLALLCDAKLANGSLGRCATTETRALERGVRGEGGRWDTYCRRARSRRKWWRRPWF
jgi:hypothetical protein